MNGKFLIRSFFWGFLLWLTGYILGIILFMIVPVSLIGLIITPFGILLTIFILIRKMHITSFKYYLFISIIWTVIAIVGDYLFIVKALNPTDGYYKIDVYLYYFLTFALPIIVGWKKYGFNKSDNL